jgi:hypothetical protein
VTAAAYALFVTAATGGDRRRETIASPSRIVPGGGTAALRTGRATRRTTMTLRFGRAWWRNPVARPRPRRLLDLPAAIGADDAELVRLSLVPDAIDRLRAEAHGLLYGGPRPR